MFATDARLNGVMEALPYPVSAFEAVRDGNGHIVDFVWVYANEAAESALGGSRRDFVGASVRQTVPTGLIAGMFDTYTRVVDSGESRHDPVVWWEDQGGDGVRTRRAFDVQASKYGDGFVVISREVTEEVIAAEMRELALEQERSLTRQLRDLDTSRAALIAAVTHDFRTPLAGIVGLSGLLDSDWDEMAEEKRREYVHDILHCGEELDRRITTTLEHLRVDGGNRDGDAQVCNVRDEVAGVLDRLRLMLDVYTVDFDMPADLFVLADPTALARVVENLLSNAVKYSPPQSRIGVRAERSDGQVTVSVADEGPGISDEDVHRIFDQFVRLDSGRRMAQGNGVGLSAVRQLVELMNGHVWVERNGDRGSVFRFSLPLTTGG